MRYGAGCATLNPFIGKPLKIINVTCSPGASRNIFQRHQVPATASGWPVTVSNPLAA